jgi:protein SCO1
MMKDWRIWAVILSLGLVVAFVLYQLANPVIQPYDGTELSGLALDFSLTDQNGSFVKLSDFRGRVVVLTFFDSRCKDTCPLTAAELLQTYKQLDQGEANRVVFAAVNVNVLANSISDVLLATQNWRLEAIPAWHFLTGISSELELVWKDYGIAVQVNPDSAVVHTSGVYILDALGQKRWYISTSFSDQGNTAPTLPLNEILVNHIRQLLRDH